MNITRQIAGICLLLTVAACSSDPSSSPTPTSTTSGPPAQTQPATPSGDPDIMPPNRVNTDMIGSAELLPPDGGSPFLMIEPNRLPGMSAEDVVRELGTPDFVSRDAGVQTMLYEAPGCVLDISLREASSNAPVRVDYVTARNRNGRLIPISNCLGQLANR